MPRKKQQGFTLIGAAMLAAVLGASIAVYGIINYYVAKAKAKSESKASAIDSESALAEYIATKFNAQGCSTAPTVATFTNGFANRISRTAPFNIGAAFSDNTVNLSLVRSGNLIDANLATGSPALMTDAITACNGASSPNFPANNAAFGVYIFCVKINRTDPSKSGTSFLNSDLAFVQFRLELMSQSTSQNEKVFGPAMSCTAWDGNPNNERQLKISYRIIWKKPNGTPQEVFSHVGSKMLNVVELRGS